MSSAATSTTEGFGVPKGAAGAFTSVLSIAVGIATAKLERKAVAWTNKLNSIAKRHAPIRGYR